MKPMILTLAAAAALGGLAAAPAAAQGDRQVVRTTRTLVVHRHVDVRNADLHRGWYRGRHVGWANHQRTCRTVWRHHQRIRTCTSW